MNSTFQTCYILENKSGSEGTYFINNEYKTLFPGQKIELTRRPTNVTNNIIITIYRKRIGEQILYKKPKTVTKK